MQSKAGPRFAVVAGTRTVTWRGVIRLAVEYTNEGQGRQSGRLLKPGPVVAVGHLGIWAAGGIDVYQWRAYNTQLWRKFRSESKVDITLDEGGLTSGGGLVNQPAAFAP